MPDTPSTPDVPEEERPRPTPPYASYAFGVLGSAAGIASAIHGMEREPVLAVAGQARLTLNIEKP
jgi:hypothetical protein